MEFVTSIFSYFVAEVGGTIPVFLLIGVFLHLLCIYKERKDLVLHCWGIAIFSSILAVIFQITGLPNINYHRINVGLSLIPFFDGFGGRDIFQYLANVILFMPVGFFFPLLWKTYGRFGKTLLTGFCLSLLIELLQLFTFRATDTTDLITNTLGTMVGFGICLLFQQIFPKFSNSFQATSISYSLAPVAGVISIVLTLALFFFLVPFQYDFIVTGHLAVAAPCFYLL